MADPQFGVVRGRYRIVEGNVTRPAAGEIVFTPVPPASFVDAPGETLYGRVAVRAVLDGDGWVHAPGSIIAYLNLPVGRWAASFTVTGMTIPPVEFDLAVGQVVILPTVAPQS